MQTLNTCAYSTVHAQISEDVMLQHSFLYKIKSNILYCEQTPQKVYLIWSFNATRQAIFQCTYHIW